MVWKELDTDFIFMALEANTYADVMEQMGQTFIQKGYCKDTFVKALIEREQEYPTGLDIDGFGVAMPHTNVNHVCKPAIGIGILKNPVTFLHMGTDDEKVDVQVVFILAVDDPVSHLEKIQGILDIIQDKTILEQFLKVENKQDIINMIQEKEMA